MPVLFLTQMLMRREKVQSNAMLQAKKRTNLEKKIEYQPVLDMTILSRLKDSNCSRK